MNRGDLYLVEKPTRSDPKRRRAIVVVSRQAVIDSNHSTVICAPVYSSQHGLASQVPVGINEGLKADSSIHCDELLSVPKPLLTHYVGHLGGKSLRLLNSALKAALALDDPELI